MSERTQASVILVVEDDPDIRRAMELLLRAEGFDILVAAEGEEALGIMQEHRPDLVVLDVMLTHVLEGMALAREMAARPEWADIPVLIVSSIKQSEYAEFFPDTGLLDNIVGFLAKPVEPDKLLQHIRKGLQRSFHQG